LTGWLGSAKFDKELRVGAESAPVKIPERHPAVNAYLQKIGKLGGTARAAALTPRQRKRIAILGGQALQAGKTPEQKSATGRKAARARWGKKRKS